jgi:large subunit ribosomal protein L35
MSNKMKTHSGAKKRFKLTGTGKVKYKQAKMRHIMTKKSQSMKRKARKGAILNKTDSRQIKALIPYA